MIALDPQATTAKADCRSAAKMSLEKDPHLIPDRPMEHTEAASHLRPTLGLQNEQADGPRLNTENEQLSSRNGSTAEATSALPARVASGLMIDFRHQSTLM